MTLRGRLSNSYNLQSPKKDFVTYFVKLIINIGPNQSEILAKYHHIDLKTHRQNNIADILKIPKNGFPNATINTVKLETAYISTYVDMYRVIIEIMAMVAYWTQLVIQ